MSDDRAQRVRETVQQLQRRFGTRALHHGAVTPIPLPPLASGHPPLDTALGGGIARGALSVISGPPSGGATTLALTLLAQTTRGGQLVAILAPATTLDPLAIVAGGIDPTLLVIAHPDDAAALAQTLVALLTSDACAAILVLDPPPSLAPTILARLGQTIRSHASAVLLVDIVDRAARPTPLAALAAWRIAIAPQGWTLDDPAQPRRHVALHIDGPGVTATLPLTLTLPRGEQR